MRGEFDLIARYFAPLAGASAGAYGLQNDAAVFEPPAGRSLVATLDTLIAGVHYLREDPAELVARKLLRVNLSDLAAMGARPLGYLLSLSLSRDTPETWVEAFATGLGEDQGAFGCRLLGGDTTGTPGPTTLSLTLLGDVAPGRAMARNTARTGDLVYVSGTLGDAALGLRALKGELAEPTESERAYLSERYRLPRPRVELGARLAEDGLATAAIDISDGLAADLAHICETSGLGADIAASSLPLSPAARAVVARGAAGLADLVTGGDDYELLFTVDPARAGAVEALERDVDCPLACIGAMGEGTAPVLRDERGEPLVLDKAGWTHF